MFGSFPFGAGYFAQGPPGIFVLPDLNPATADVICLVHGDVGIILIRPDVGMILVRSETSEVEP
jgi:hypothetical protein